MESSQEIVLSLGRIPWPQCGTKPRRLFGIKGGICREIRQEPCKLPAYLLEDFLIAQAHGIAGA